MGGVLPKIVIAVAAAGDVGNAGAGIEDPEQAVAQGSEFRGRLQFTEGLGVALPDPRECAVALDFFEPEVRVIGLRGRGGGKEREHEQREQGGEGKYELKH